MAVDFSSIAPNTPIIVGAGQSVERDAGTTSHLGMASQAAAMAIADCGGNATAQNIDTICVIRLFSDSAPNWQSELGRSNNPPESIATAIGASPSHRIYSHAGGNEPQALLMEFFANIAAGEKEMVLLAGAEALRNQRKAQKQELQLDWNEEFTAPLEDRGIGNIYPDPQEIANGMLMPLQYYNLIEQARRNERAMSREDYLDETARLMASFSEVAANNPYAQWPGVMSAAEIRGAEPLTDLYTKRMIAQDSVNQGAALLLTSVAKARELEIPEARWVFMHGAAQGADVDVSVRPTPGTSVVAGNVLDKALDMATCTPADIDLIDIYSCFPCAVSEISDHLGLPADGSVPLTLTGGLPFFGGPGNNYSMHGLAEMVWQLRKAPGQLGLVHANGGFLTKHAAGVFSCAPSKVDWATADTQISPDAIQRCERANSPETGVVISYCVNFYQGTPVSVIVLAETDAGQRFVCCTAPEDNSTAAQVLATDPTGERVTVSPGEHEHCWHLKLVSNG